MRLVAALLLPLIAFVVLVRSLGNATEALAITEAIPGLWLLAYAVWRRRIEPVGLTALALFAIALLLPIALGGSSLPLERHLAVFPGAVGLACLISLAARRPLLSIASARTRLARPEATDATHPNLDTPAAQHILATLTAIIGVMLSTDAAAQIALALTVSPSTFGIVARVASYVIIGTGLAVCGLYLRRVRGRLQHEDKAPPDQESKPHPGQPAAAERNAASCEPLTSHMMRLIRTEPLRTRGKPESYPPSGFRSG
jgi:hypothetical protein